MCSLVVGGNKMSWLLLVLSNWKLIEPVAFTLNLFFLWALFLLPLLLLFPFRRIIITTRVVSFLPSACLGDTFFKGYFSSSPMSNKWRTFFPRFLGECKSKGRKARWSGCILYCKQGFIGKPGMGESGKCIFFRCLCCPFQLVRLRLLHWSFN